MPRTTEQIAADDNLTEAIEAVQAAYYSEYGDDASPHGVLTSYVVLAKRKWWDEDGDGVTASYSIPKDNDVPIDELLGMVEYASTRYRKSIAEDEVDE
jgi:hypothetical protein